MADVGPSNYHHRSAHSFNSIIPGAVGVGGPQIEMTLESIRSSGYEAIPSVQVRGLFAISFPVLDTQGRAIAALTVPYAERIDQCLRKSVPDVTAVLEEAAKGLSARIGGARKFGGQSLDNEERSAKRTAKA